ncbi:sulfur carrier protein ThiS [Rhodococcus rhodnii]|uniref:Sulfur transfer protein ThiS n=2 Tax=Rhodococcus rhodnii TaxID=38312 RepID=R7WRM4_9NOCA|nr:sulfur carrier protein ThiS [Rhodococcus rhodnii]EOM77982.1 sulfur transfer protein ThiS [Rhodococcus rhodnii LMG 5362]TXG92052.1 sulfur carrier protein ThiS [Rhodococcus rhodnii]
MTDSPTTIPVGVTVNGEDHEFDTAITILELLERLSLPTKGIAVAVDGAVHPRTRWDRPIERGWQIEILTAVQGG